MMKYGIGTNEAGEIHVRIEADGKELGFFFDDVEEARLFAERILTAAAQALAVKKSRAPLTLVHNQGD